MKSMPSRRTFVRTCASAGSPRSARRSSASPRCARAAASCSCCCAAASTGSPPSSRTATRRTSRCAARSRSTTSELVALNDVFGLAPGLAPLKELWEPERARRAARDGDSVSHAQPLRRPGDPRDRHRPPGRIVGRMAEPAAAGDAGQASRDRDRVGLAALDDRHVRRADVVADAARRRGRRVPRAARRCSTAPTASCTAGSRRRCSSRRLSAKSRWPGQNARRGGITPLMRAAARILRQDKGPNIAAVEFSGWDTHANQGLAGGALDRLLGQLAEGLVTLRTEMGPAWAEHHRRRHDRVRADRTAQRDARHRSRHRRGGLPDRPAGRAVRVFADWPGLGDGALFEGRDLKPTLDTRAVLKAAIAGTFDLTPAQADRVFPSSCSRERCLRVDGVDQVPIPNPRLPKGLGGWVGRFGSWKLGVGRFKDYIRQAYCSLTSS